MGNKVTTFSDHQLECYQDCTYFTRKEILMIFRRFSEGEPSRFPEVMRDEDCRNIKLPLHMLLKMADMRENPLAERICRVFSNDGSGDMAFDEYLNMWSMFSEQCPRNTKIHFAFKIYDHDQDGFVGKADLRKTLVALTRNLLSYDEVDVVIGKVLNEADQDCDGQISFDEFRHVVIRAPDFMK